MKDKHQNSAPPAVEVPAAPIQTAPAGSAPEVSAPATPVPAPAPSPIEAPKNPAQKRKRRKLMKRLIIGGGLVAIVAIYLLVKGGDKGGKVDPMLGYLESPVETRNITESLSGSGVLAPAESYVMTTLVSGDITAAPFEEGDTVEKGTVLYQVDNSKLGQSVEQSELSLRQSQRSHQQSVDKKQDLNVKAPRAGSVVTMTVKPGDTVQAGQEIATLRNSSIMKLTLPFNAADADSFYVGQPATVTMEGSFETLQGTIETVGASQVLAGGMPVRNITISVQNPGAIGTDQGATAMVGGAACNGSGKFTYADELKVLATLGGEVSRVLVKEGDNVTQDQILVELYSKELNDQIANSSDAVRNAELALEGTLNQMGDYEITSPISGTIIEKNYKAGDKLETGKTLCTVFDLTYLKMTMNVDELDVSKIKEGQQVHITADAMEGKTFVGTVTKININGTTANGVTTYPVTVRLDEYEGLLPGMNVDANIVVESRENVLAVPAGAVVRGNQVLVKTGASGDKTPAKDGKEEDKAPVDDKSSAGASLNAAGSASTAGGAGGAAGAVGAIPPGYEYRDVTLGISDKDYIEITSGLKADDIIAYLPSAGASSSGPMMGGGGMIMVG